MLRHRVILTYEAEAEEITSETGRAQAVRARRSALSAGGPPPCCTRELLKKIRKIEIVTERLVRDRLAGQYHSVFKGRGMAFSEVRAVHARATTSG